MNYGVLNVLNGDLYSDILISLVYEGIVYKLRLQKGDVCKRSEPIQRENYLFVSKKLKDFK